MKLMTLADDRASLVHDKALKARFGREWFALSPAMKAFYSNQASETNLKMQDLQVQKQSASLKSAPAPWFDTSAAQLLVGAVRFLLRTIVVY